MQEALSDLEILMARAKEMVRARPSALLPRVCSELR